MKNLNRKLKKSNYLTWSGYLGGCISGMGIHSIILCLPVVKDYDLFLVVPLTALALHFVNKAMQISREEDKEFRDYFNKRDED